VWIVLVLVLLLPATPEAPAADVEAGGHAYRVHCARCHGVAGEGGRGPNLANGDFYHGGTDDDLFRTIRRGIDGTEMPGFPFTAPRIHQVIAYVRSLNEASEPDTVPGDAANGAALFGGKGGCLACHRVGREGGYSGPDLSTIGSRRSADHLEESLLQPSEEVDVAFRRATIETADGEIVTGFIRSDDRHWLLLLDLDGRLRSFPKDELKSVEVDRDSIMQSYEGLLEADEVEDLVAYLATLRKERSR